MLFWFLVSTAGWHRAFQMIQHRRPCTFGNSGFGVCRSLSVDVEQGTVIVESISRFARNTRDLLDLVENLSEKGVEFVSKKEAIDTTTPTGKFMLTVFGAVAEQNGFKSQPE